MFSVFSKRLALLSALLLAMPCSLIAWECCEAPKCNRVYVGVFGGGIYSTSTRISQMGTALFSELEEGGPLAVEARGHAPGRGSGFGGVHIGCEWVRRPFHLCSGWCITPGAELEAFWYSHTKRGHLSNTTDIDRIPEHDFLDTFPMHAGVYLANAVFSVRNCCRLSPYLGLGVGVTRISIHDATSVQVAPPEAGINHFNSDTNDAAWTFAAQVKAGLRYNICGSFHLFGEYRYLYVDFSKYIFGSTVYPNHAHTTPWNVKFHNMQYNAFAFGIQYDL